MSTKMVAAITLAVLFSLGLAFQDAPYSTIFICAFSILLGSAIPDIDRLFYPVWKYLRYLVILMGAILFAYVFLLAPTICFYFTIPLCQFLLPAGAGLLLLFIFMFDFLDPSRPPFHSLVALAISTLTYSIILSYIGFVHLSFLGAGAFAAAYALHYFLESANVDCSRLD